MGDDGLSAVLNPSELFLSERSATTGTSSAVTVTLEGTRPLLLEVQGLCSPTHAVGGPGPPPLPPPPILHMHPVPNASLFLDSPHACTSAKHSPLHVGVICFH